MDALTGAETSRSKSGGMEEDEVNWTKRGDKCRHDQAKTCGPTGATGTDVSWEIKPMLHVMLYTRPVCENSLVEASVASLESELDCDIRRTYLRQLQPVVSNRLQVDVIECWNDDICSVVKDFGFTEQTVGQRHLVLLDRSRGGGLTQTHHVLGQHTRLFKHITWCPGYPGYASQDADDLADYLRESVGLTRTDDQKEMSNKPISRKHAISRPILTQPAKPKLSVVLYYISGWGSDLLHGSVRSLDSELECDVRECYSSELQPMDTDWPQVDVIDCWHNLIHSVVREYRITEEIAGQRHLVLMYGSPNGSLRKTRRVLGQHAQLFKHIVWYRLIPKEVCPSTNRAVDVNTGPTEEPMPDAVASLADYFREVSLQIHQAPTPESDCML